MGPLPARVAYVSFSFACRCAALYGFGDEELVPSLQEQEVSERGLARIARSSLARARASAVCLVLSSVDVSSSVCLCVLFGLLLVSWCSYVLVFVSSYPRTVIRPNRYP